MQCLAYTVNETERAGTLWMAGLDGLITDRVDLFEPQARLGGRSLSFLGALALG
jgi:glycerophosphoryl diester phosphodiesterase